MIFIESPEFTKEAAGIFADDDLLALQLWLVENPASGDIIRQSGGCRKIRWAAGGRGKRGGARVIYFHRIAYPRYCSSAPTRKTRKQISPLRISKN